MSEIDNELGKLYTIKQVTEYFKLTRQTLNKLEKQGKLVPVRIGSSIRYKKSDIEKILSGQKE